ncbi:MULTISPECIES: biopolymer transporter ExbD [unclassified Leptolyngbya]|uniref:ExbD/TolR family protein n=1 Tax=unclassified Leptolyngbya TaxID=2650499 RepID=UPI0016876990|nr:MULTISPECIES: biopolymer transporter ExbD [unclassified Leptolyngbya]MBD1913822.1 biopolymer transporter ExbD [Leptolyngbya sp. FACHB-8]MBD2156539.1 biopolymer transporter ExbD [Leptolyngbya sp. FACHB-16]
MGFRKRRRATMPELNLVPMMDVLMTVLTFFIIVSMTLSLDQGVEVTLPSNQPQPAVEEPPPSVLIVEMDSEGQFSMEGETLEKAQLLGRLRFFLQQDEKAQVVFQANPSLPYEQVLQTLTELKQVGGDRISLAIE